SRRVARPDGPRVGLTAVGRAGYRGTVTRFSVNQITTLGWPFERDVEAYAAAGAPAVGVAIRKLETCGVARAAQLLRGAGLKVSCLTSSGPFPLGDEPGERAALERVRRHLDAAAALGADCLMLLPGNAVTWAWEEAAARARPLIEALIPAAQQARVR